MKTRIEIVIAALAIGVGIESASAQLTIPSDGSDGALVITSDTVIDLGQAITGNWDTNNGANAGKGVYDSAKWAVVFKYSGVVVQGGSTVTFKNHSGRAPVVWLVSGDVTINGTVSLDGQGYLPAPWLAEPGPGGFRGGSANYAPGAADAAGFGPGGGAIRVSDYASLFFGAGGSYGSVGSYGPPAYGNPSLIPLIGGSGGGGRYAYVTSRYDLTGRNGKSGGAGGGAMLIATAGNLSIAGMIHADGGNGMNSESPDANQFPWSFAGGGGGGIRLVAASLTGNGVVRALGGNGGTPGGLGRIRVERVANTNTLQITPDPSVVTLSNGATPQIWLPVNGPMVRVVSVGGINAPADPLAEFGAVGADVTLPQTTGTTVVAETSNVERASIVTIRVTPRSDGNFTETTATMSEVVSEDPLVLRWKANVPVKNGYAAVQVKVVRP